MTSFLAIGNYSPLIVLAVGLATFAGYWGTGTVLLHATRVYLPSPWQPLVAVLLGIQGTSLAVQSAGMADLASREVLDAIWLAVTTIGLVMLVLSNHRSFIGFIHNPKKPALPRSIGVVHIVSAIIGIAAVTDLLIALAPSSKIDELYYHMLVPSRIVADGALHFYRLPWEGAIWPQMVYQIAEAPIYSIGYPDAANIVSWGLSITLLWFAWNLIRAGNKTVSWSALWTGCLCVGLYPAVWWDTAGAHAMGDLAVAAAIVGFSVRSNLRKVLSPTTYALMMSILLLSAATSKISLLPLSGLLLGAEFLILTVSAPFEVTLKSIGAAVVPWIIFYFPIACWTWTQSGSPFGPVLAPIMLHSVYPAGWVQATLQHTRQINQTSLLTTLRYAALNYSPLIWLGVVGALASTNISASVRSFLAFLLAMQVALVYWLLPYDARFLGGLQYGLVIVFAAFAKSGLEEKLKSPRTVGIACVLFLLPWLAAQLFYGKQFFPVSLGLEKEAFYRRYIAFYADFVKLNQILPKHTVILAQGFRLDAVYAPRPIFFDSADLPSGRPVVLLNASEGVTGFSVPGYKVGDIVYQDPKATVQTFRTPDSQAILGSIKVVDLVPE